MKIYRFEKIADDTRANPQSSEHGILNSIGTGAMMHVSVDGEPERSAFYDAATVIRFCSKKDSWAADEPAEIREDRRTRERPRRPDDDPFALALARIIGDDLCTIQEKSPQLYDGRVRAWKQVVEKADIHLPQFNLFKMVQVFDSVQAPAAAPAS